MHVEAQDGTVILKVLGGSFASRDAERMAELLGSLAPFSQLVLDFSKVRQCDNAALLPLVEMLRRFRNAAVVLRGLTLHEARLLRYLGLRASEVQARA